MLKSLLVLVILCVLPVYHAVNCIFLMISNHSLALSSIIWRIEHLWVFWKYLTYMSLFAIPLTWFLCPATTCPPVTSADSSAQQRWMPQPTSRSWATHIPNCFVELWVYIRVISSSQRKKIQSQSICKGCVHLCEKEGERGRRGWEGRDLCIASYFHEYMLLFVCTRSWSKHNANTIQHLV